MLEKCPRCGCRADVPWIWKLLFKVTNPFGMKKLTQIPVDIDMDINATVASIVTDEAVSLALKDEKLRALRALRAFLSGPSLRLLLDKILPDKITQKELIFHCWNCGYGKIMPEE